MRRAARIPSLIHTRLKFTQNVIKYFTFRGCTFPRSQFCSPRYQHKFTTRRSVALSEPRKQRLGYDKAYRYRQARIQRLRRGKTGMAGPPAGSRLLFLLVLELGLGVVRGARPEVGLGAGEGLVAPEPPVEHGEELEWAVRGDVSRRVDGWNMETHM